MDGYFQINRSHVTQRLCDTYFIFHPQNGLLLGWGLRDSSKTVYGQQLPRRGHFFRMRKSVVRNALGQQSFGGWKQRQARDPASYLIVDGGQERYHLGGVGRAGWRGRRTPVPPSGPDVGMGQAPHQRRTDPEKAGTAAGLNNVGKQGRAAIATAASSLPSETDRTPGLPRGLR